jgi:RsiW-degrading membrane proteinase PrsW (M82 family)
MLQVASVAGETERKSSSHVAWLSWLLGAALLVAVIAAVLHFAEERAFVRVAQEAEPWWLLLAACLQGTTYLAQARSFAVCRAPPRTDCRCRQPTS